MTSRQLPHRHPTNPPPPPFNIHPPLINSSNPWATTRSDLLSLYASPFTGAVTIRTSLWGGFPPSPSTHQYVYFSTEDGKAGSDARSDGDGRGKVRDAETSSLNTLGYSPVAFEAYVEMLVCMSREGLLSLGSDSEEGKPRRKPFIVSVTGTAEEVGRCASHLLTVLNDVESSYPSSSSAHTTTSTSSSSSSVKNSNSGVSNIDIDLDLMMEVNLSCPNIPDKPPPAYSLSALGEYITAIRVAKQSVPSTYSRFLHVGIKIPPYTYSSQFQVLISALESSSSPGVCPITFITAVNTLGGCLVLTLDNEPALGSVSGSGIGGMAGDALHPLALGNVKSVRAVLDGSGDEGVRGIRIIGVGGVRDWRGFERMRGVGADVVGVGTALGREGVGIFEKITVGNS